MAKEKKIDKARADYMIAWRDRYIERLQEQLAGREEANAPLSALLFCALCGEEREHHESYISADALRAALSQWSCEVERGDEGYLLRFSKKECADGGEASEG